LDLNQDGYVDYLRVLEVAEGDARVIVIQAVLGQDQFQDVATIELEKQRATASNSSSATNVNIQIVGNPYIYGPNYIYEPYYYRQPVFFDFFWMPTYRPYYSPWYWGYYPTYYSYWAPVPYFRYNRNVYGHINQNNRYIYTDNRRVSRADRMYSNVRGNSYERQNPSRSFEGRNSNVTNRYVYDKERTTTRTANAVNDRSSINTGNRVDRSSINTGNRVDGTVNSGRVDRSSSNVSDARLNTTRVRSDFNENRTNYSGETRVSVPSSRINTSVDNSNRISTPARTTSQPAQMNSSNQRIERTSRSSNESFNRSSNSGSFNRSSSSPAPSRSMSAPVSRGGSSGGGRTIGR